MLLEADRAMDGMAGRVEACVAKRMNLGHLGMLAEEMEKLEQKPTTWPDASIAAPAAWLVASMLSQTMRRRHSGKTLVRYSVTSRPATPRHGS